MDDKTMKVDEGALASVNVRSDPASPATQSTSIGKNATTVDQVLERLSKVLSIPTGLDKSLATLSYSSLLISTLLTSLSASRGRRNTRVQPASLLLLSSNGAGGVSIVIPARVLPSRSLLIISKRLRALYTLIADVRVFMRLWGLLAIYRWGKQVWQHAQPADPVLRTIAIAQVAVNILFQSIENLAYLSSKETWHWSAKKQAQAWKWSARFWFSHVALEIAKLAWVARQKSSTRPGHALAKGEAKEESKAHEQETLSARNADLAWWKAWKSDLAVNAAYAPLTMHWSREAGLLSDMWVGALGTIASGIGLANLWNQSA